MLCVDQPANLSVKSWDFQGRFVFLQECNGSASVVLSVSAKSASVSYDCASEQRRFGDRQQTFSLLMSQILDRNSFCAHRTYFLKIFEDYASVHCGRNCGCSSMQSAETRRRGTRRRGAAYQAAPPQHGDTTAFH